MFLDIFGYMILENCSIFKMEEEVGQISIEFFKSSIIFFWVLKRLLQFFGFFENFLCCFMYILVYKVSGDKNEEQVLNVIEVYMEYWFEIILWVINLFFDIVCIECCNQLLWVLKLVIMVFKCYKYDRNI